MKRIIMHWTAGRNTVSETDKKHYHFIVDDNGNVVTGNNPVSANEGPIKGAYAAHTLNCNTDSIGVAVAGMWNAQERPFNAGPSPMTQRQIDALVKLVARLCREYAIPVTPQTVLSHAEVQPTLGIKQRGKWDIAWLPGMTAADNPVKVGERLRQAVRAAMVVDATPAPPPFTRDTGGWIAAWIKAISAMFGKR